jgi:TetR/AcrR family transcriptional repressor of mexCD-oprJ operon
VSFSAARPEAIARIARVVAAGGSKYAALIGRFGPADGRSVDQQVKTTIEALLRRGIDDGTFRGDLTTDELAILLGSLLQAAARMAAEHRAGVEKAAALVTSVFLHGTQNCGNGAAGHRATTGAPGPDPASTAT